ncbi:recombinase family protein [Streptomyces sp. NPDC005065]|uniref:recombinase family protein n=1 Tax=Streptomyces sp. NPDC005065 TaxID=3154461 RepID=UPI0033BE56B5
MTSTTANAPLNAVIYARLSDGSDNTPAQVRRCRELGARLGANIVAVKVDDDRTAMGKNGQRADRPAYDETIEMLVSRQANVVLCIHTDRLYRQSRDLEPLIDVVEKTHAMIHPVVTGPLDLSSASGRMVARMLAAVASHEVERARERMLDKKEDLRAAGVNHGGPRAFGFKKVKRHAKGEPPQVPQVDEQEAQLIRDAANAVLAHAADPETGLTLAGICRQWTAKGVKTPRGNAWTVPSLRKTLLSPRIAGRVAHQGEDAGPAQWDAVLSHDVWLAVRTVLTDPARRSGPTDHDGRTVRYLGSGIYHCHCGAVVRPGGAGAGQAQLYRCTQGGHVSRTAAPIDDYVERVIIARLCRQDARDAFTAPAAAIPAGAPMEDLSARHAALKGRLEALADAFADDDDTDPLEYRAASRRLRERITAVEQEITDAATAAASAAEPGPLADVDLPELVRRHAEDPAALDWWRQTYPMEQRRKILATLVTVTLLRARQGRPAGFVPGSASGYFDPESVAIEWVK